MAQSNRNQRSQKVDVRVPLALFDALTAAMHEHETVTAFIVEAIRRKVERRKQPQPAEADSGNEWY